MPGELTVPVGWALWSKPAGTRQDYSVVACSSEPFSSADFAAIITRFAVGTPDTTASGTDALPWTTVSWVGVDAALHLGIAITDKTGQVDGVGRPITQTSYYCVPYDRLAEAAEKYKAPVSYAALCEAAASQPLHPRDGGPIQLAIRPPSADLMADMVRRFGEQAVAATAALLLTGPVGVVAAEGSTPRERLDYIDAVACLLPFGYRTKFSAATWSESGTKHRVRLTFGGYPREDAATIAWRRGAESSALQGLARIYFEQLRRLSAGSSGSLAAREVIAHLAADIRPRRFEQPQDALDSLNRFDQPFRLVRAVRDRSGISLAELRQVFSLGRVKELPAETDVAVLLAELAGRGEPEDWPDVRRGLAGLGSAQDRARILTAFGRRMIWMARPDTGRALDCVRFAAELGVEDGVLAELIRPPDGVAGHPAGAQAAADLLLHTVLAASPPPREYPRTLELLADDLVAVAEYVAALSRTGRASSLLRLLDPAGTSRLGRAFRVALGLDEGTVDSSGVTELSGYSVDCVRALLQAASQAGRLDAVLPGLTRWLAARGELDQGERRYWAEHLARLDPRTPRSQAWLDTSLLIIGAAPSALPPAHQSTGTGYSTDLAGIWSGLSKDYSLFSAERCAHGLARYLGGQPWAQTRQQAQAVTELTGLLRGFDPRDVLVSVVASALAATPAARQWDFARDWLAWAMANDPAAVRERLLDSLATAPPGAEPGYLAGLCVRACREGIDPDTALRRLARAEALTGASQASQVLMTLRQAFCDAEIDGDTTQQWQFRLCELLAGGEFGVPLALELRELASDRTRREIWLNLRLLAIFAADGGDRQHEWTEPERKDLAQIADEIEAMLKKSRKFALPKLRSRSEPPPEKAEVPGEARVRSE